MGEPGDKARIEQLETELAELRAQVAHLAPPADTPHQAPASPHEERAAAREIGIPRRSRMVLFGAAVVLLSIGFFVAIYTALSKGFSSLATKAASSYSSEFSEEQDDAPTSPAPSEVNRRANRPEPPPVPGL